MKEKKKFPSHTDILKTNKENFNEYFEGCLETPSFESQNEWLLEINLTTCKKKKKNFSILVLNQIEVIFA